MFRRLLIVAIACVAIPVFADDKKAAPAPTKEQQAGMESMMKHATPGEPHKLFEKLAGKWTYEGKFWMDPKGDPFPLKGTAEGKLAMEGRFYMESAKGSDPAMPFEGKAWWGYDNHKKKYEFVWIDSMTTSISKGEGTFDAKTNTLTWQSEAYDAMHGKVMKMKETSVIKGDKIEKTFYLIQDGKEVKTMELTYTRAK